MRLIPSQVRKHNFTITAMAMSTIMPSQQPPRTSSSTPIAYFDAHNHIHLSMQGGIPPLTTEAMYLMSGDDNKGPIANTPIESENDISSHADSIVHAFSSKKEEVVRDEFSLRIRGMAIMSTQPRDFPIVKQLANALCDWDTNERSATTIDLRNEMYVVRCYGVHPWFLKRANNDFANCANLSMHHGPAWINYLKYNLESDPTSHVGEIGLDAARYDIDPLTKEKVLAATMESQIEAFESQMHLAADLKRSVSVHAVKCWGPLMNSLNDIKKARMKMRKEHKSLRQRLERERELCESDDERNHIIERLKGIEDDVLILPPIIYFHAFGGKPAVVDQLDAICREKSMTSYVTETFYGFAPVVNFRSPKTESVLQKVGIKRLVLESDLEDYHCVPNDLETSAVFTARVFGMEKDEVIRRTNSNARYIYGLVND
jgi:Tat protein secretion system quality control protein TatD with DNase activity